MQGEKTKSSPGLSFFLRHTDTLEECLFLPFWWFTWSTQCQRIHTTLDWLSGAKNIHQYSWFRFGLEGLNVLALQLAGTCIMQHSEDQHTELGTSMFQHFIPVSVLFTWHNHIEILTSRRVWDEAAPRFQSFLTGPCLVPCVSWVAASSSCELTLQQHGKFELCHCEKKQL